jgi:glycosyltransferase involved in cell wall biosynthesis
MSKTSQPLRPVSEQRLNGSEDSMNSPSPGIGIVHQDWVALLGRQDTPVDGVDDYCTFLGRALVPQGVRLRKVRVQWFEEGRVRALLGLWRDRAEWREKRVLLQYTALSWSRRGFPFYALVVVAALGCCGAQCAIVFHEPQGIAVSTKWIARLRRASQNWVARGLHLLATKSIFVEPPETISWLQKPDPKAAFIPIGANIPERAARFDRGARNGSSFAVAVFCVSDEPNLHLELHDIAVAAGKAAESGAEVRIVFLGRGTTNAAAEIERIFQGVPVKVTNLGIVSAETVAETLCECDAMLSVRGKVCSNRGSAIAGIACGLPVVGYAGGAEGTPLAEAGLVLVSYRDAEALGDALANVLNDPGYARELSDKSVRAQRTYFSWDVLARDFIEFLRAPQNGA